MQTTIIILVVAAMVITSIINFAKPAYKKFAGRFYATITIALSFILWIVASFSVAPYLWLELNNWILILLWLALWTGSNLFYDMRELVKNTWDKIRSTIEGE